MPKITFHPAGKSGEIPAGTNLLDAAEKLGITIDHDCGGFATCSTCRILIVEGPSNLTEIDLDEENMLEEAELPPPFRLSCQAKLQGDVTARIPDKEMKWSKEALEALNAEPTTIRQVTRVVVEAKARKKGLSDIGLEMAQPLLEEVKQALERVRENPDSLSAFIKEAYGIE